MEKAVLFEVKNNIAIITLNRPERHNSFNQELLTLLYDYMEEVMRNDTIKVAILTGNGKSFCSGIDLGVLGKEDIFNPRGDNKEWPDFIVPCDKPVIGAINGAAITGGFELALNCDFLIASENAKFGDTHAKVGIHPGWGMTQLLQQAVGQRRAKQMHFTCKYISAQTAYEWGLVNEVVPADQLMSRTMEIAQDICNVNDTIMMKIKKLVENQNSMNLKDSYLYERKEFKAFVEKAMAAMNK